MKYLKNIVHGIKTVLFIMFAPVFCLFSSVVIHLSGLDEVDHYPSHEEIKRQNEWAKQLLEEQKKRNDH